MPDLCCEASDMQSVFNKVMMARLAMTPTGLPPEHPSLHSESRHVVRPLTSGYRDY